jgi:hypothetical protein
VSGESRFLPDLNIVIKTGFSFGGIKFSGFVAKTPTANAINKGIGG